VLKSDHLGDVFFSVRALLSSTVDAAEFDIDFDFGAELGLNSVFGLDESLLDIQVSS